jgi:hypothetical protein
MCNYGEYRTFLALAIALGVPAIAVADPGFGTLRKKNIDLEVRQPALVC